MNASEYDSKYIGDEDDVDLLHDNPQVRLGLYYALKDTRGEPGLSLKMIANVVMTALSREEVVGLVNELNRNLES